MIVAEKMMEVEQAPQMITIEEAIEAMQHFECQQNPEELAKVLELIQGKARILEIGSNFGGSLRRMAEVLAPNSKVVSVDLPEHRHRMIEPIFSLEANCKKIGEMGHSVELVLGNSHKKEIQERVRQWAPYDFIFIDGDHSYEGVKQDWLDYGPMGKMVGFHDIGGGTEGCVRFWGELRKENGYRFEEFRFPRYLPVAKIWMNLGIGVVFRES